MQSPLLNLKPRDGRFSAGANDPRLDLMRNASERCPGVETGLIDAITKNKTNPVPGFNPYAKCIELCQTGCPPGSVDCNYVCGEIAFDGGAPNTFPPIPTVPPGSVTQYPMTTPSLTNRDKDILNNCLAIANINSRSCSEDVLNCCATSDMVIDPVTKQKTFPMMGKPGFMQYCAELTGNRCNPTTTTKAPSGNIVVNPSIPTTFSPNIPSTMTPTMSPMIPVLSPTTMPPTMPPTIPTTGTPYTTTPGGILRNTTTTTTTAPPSSTSRVVSPVSTTAVPETSDDSAKCDSSESSDCNFFKKLLKLLLFLAGVAVIVLLIIKLNQTQGTGNIQEKIPMATPVYLPGPGYTSSIGGPNMPYGARTA